MYDAVIIDAHRCSVKITAYGNHHIWKCAGNNNKGLTKDTALLLMGIYGGIPILIRGVHVKGPMLQNMLQFMLQICCRGLVKKKYGRGGGIVDGAPDSGAPSLMAHPTAGGRAGRKKKKKKKMQIEGGIDAIIGANGARARPPKTGKDTQIPAETGFGMI
ncbi:hypothetical protein DFH07DRAFT_780095 [Mycena maculata]|uniref:Uncharacterized protein n=1 Tax=Mycena maculata TaxID=230809 RepID=A0AAD7MVQ0_9AGAR|nr:hypothetical protein DFH07DRAFT_780095 [Mycena maculata]